MVFGQDMYIMDRDAIKKKLADLRTLSQLSLTPPPLGPIRTNFNLDIYLDCYPSPPLLHLGQYSVEIFKILGLCIIIILYLQ